MSQDHAHLRGFDIVELRRYSIAPGQADRFGAWFDAYFPEAFEQLGALVVGQFVERREPDRFFWLRGYRRMDDRPVVNSAFYYGPVWREHRGKIRSILLDSRNALLMQAVPGHPVPVLPAVDPLGDAGAARGTLVVQLLPVVPDREDEAVAALAGVAAGYPREALLDAGLLRTLDEPNNYPQLPLRTDVPWVAWIGLVRDDDALRGLEAAMDAAEQALQAGGWLRGPAERIVAAPTPRSRLRWPGADAAR